MLANRLLLPAIAILVILALSGCALPEEGEFRALCAKLTNTYNAGIPNCASQDACIKEFEKSFPLDAQYFDPYQKEFWNSYKNYISASWLQYNLAKSLASELQNDCFSGKIDAEFAVKINELRSLTVSAFDSIDKADKAAVAFIEYSKKDLEDEDIELMPKTGLSDHYAQLLLNIQELKEMQPAKDSTSFAALLLKNQKEMKQFMEDSQIGSASAVELQAEDISDFYLSIVYLAFPQIFAPVPILSPMLEEMISFTSGKLADRQGISSLEKIDLMEIERIFAKFAGKTGSCAEQMHLLAQENSAAKREFTELMEKTNAETDALFQATKENIAKIDPESYSALDQNFLEQLFAISRGKSATISASGFSMNEFSALKENAESQYLLLEGRYLEWKRQESINGLSPGKSYSELKSINQELGRLNLNISQLSEKSFSEIEASCIASKTIISQKISEISAGSGNELLGMKIYLEQKIQEFENEKIPGRISTCREMLEKYLAMKGIIENPEKISEINEQILQCLENSKNLLENGKNYGLEIYRGYFNSLVLQEKPYTDPAKTLEDCKYLESTMSEKIRMKIDASALEETYQKIAKKIQYLGQISIAGEYLDESEFENAKSDFYDLKKYFPNGKISIINAIKDPDLELILLGLDEKTDKLLYGALGHYFRDRAKLRLQSIGKIMPNEAVEAGIWIEIDNPFEGFEREIEISGLETGNAEIISFECENNEVSKYSHKTNLISLTFNRMEYGKNTANCRIKLKFAKLDYAETMTISASAGIIERTILLDSFSNLSKINIEQKLPTVPGLEIITLYWNHDAVPYSLKEHVISFELANCSKKEEILLKYRAPNIIGQKIGLESRVELDLNRFKYLYSIAFTENYPAVFAESKLNRNIYLLIPLPISAQTIKSRKLYGPFGESIETLLHSDNSIAFSVNSEKLFSGNFLLEIETNDENRYWQNVISNIESDLSKLTGISDQQIGQNAIELLAELRKTSKTFNPESKSDIEKIISLNRQASELSQKTKQLNDGKQDYLSLKKIADLRIEFAKSKLSEMEKNSLQNEAKNLRGAISSANNLLVEAENLFKTGDYRGAIEKLSDALDLISKSDSKGIEELFSEKISDISKKLKQLKSDSKKLKLPISLLNEEKTISELKNSAETAISDGNFSLAAEKIAKMGEEISDSEKKFNESVLSTSELKKQAAFGLGERAKKELPKRLKNLQNQLSAIDKELLLQLGYAVPISDAELSEIESELGEISSNMEKLGIWKLDETADANQYLAEFSAIESSVNTQSKKLDSIESDLDKKENKLKNDALHYYEMANEKKKVAQFSAKADALLENAKNSIDNGKYLEAAQYAIAANAEMDLKSNSGLFNLFSDFPIGLVVLGVICACAAYFAFLKERQDKKPPIMKKVQNGRYF